MNSEEDSNKLMAAITAALACYIEDETKSQPVSIPSQKPLPTSSPWQLSARSEMMLMRTLWQRRLVRLRNIGAA